MAGGHRVDGAVPDALSNKRSVTQIEGYSAQPAGQSRLYSSTACVAKATQELGMVA